MANEKNFERARRHQVEQGFLKKFRDDLLVTLLAMALGLLAGRMISNTMGKALAGAKTAPVATQVRR